MRVVHALQGMQEMVAKDENLWELHRKWPNSRFDWNLPRVLSNKWHN
jgi:hypothetical protein